MASPNGEQLDELEFRAWRAFVYAHATVVPTLDRELADAQGLSLSQFEVLTWLARAGRRGLRRSDLASRVVLREAHRGRPGRFAQRANVHVLGLREHFLKHLSRTELEDLAASSCDQ